uniref:Zf-U1 domain-containing protein n=1 Tax=Meloidogyne hapla TaxID=6305 RepID=A0A1I8BCT7_MELHA
MNFYVCEICRPTGKSFVYDPSKEDILLNHFEKLEHKIAVERYHQGLSQPKELNLFPGGFILEGSSDQHSPLTSKGKNE